MQADDRDFKVLFWKRMSYAASEYSSSILIVILSIHIVASSEDPNTLEEL